jgi:hypothetical protein
MRVSSPAAVTVKPVIEGVPVVQLGMATPSESNRPSVASPLWSTYSTPRLTVTLTGFSPPEGWSSTISSLERESQRRRNVG